MAIFNWLNSAFDTLLIIVEEGTPILVGLYTFMYWIATIGGWFIGLFGSIFGWFGGLFGG